MYIYYTGKGAKKSGKHTEKEFLKIMKENPFDTCSLNKFELTSAPCIEYKSSLRKLETTKYKTAKKKCVHPLFTNNKISNTPSCKYIKKQDDKWYKTHNGKKTAKLMKKCHTAQFKTNEHTRVPCNLNEYIEWSGASKRK